MPLVVAEYSLSWIYTFFGGGGIRGDREAACVELPPSPSSLSFSVSLCVYVCVCREGVLAD